MVCGQCKRKEPYEASAWFDHIWFLHQLRQGGYPFGPDELDIEEWLELGELSDELEAIKSGAIKLDE